MEHTVVIVQIEVLDEHGIHGYVILAVDGGNASGKVATTLCQFDVHLPSNLEDSRHESTELGVVGLEVVHALRDSLEKAHEGIHICFCGDDLQQELVSLVGPLRRARRRTNIHTLIFWSKAVFTKEMVAGSTRLGIMLSSFILFFSDCV